ncbi:ABC transporter permease [Aurantimonas sp. VKM B-3413]|uniref:ABC transporter permease n=1 Tax=Aurantimonas sp. VKM B-3413 TaxID=2779401 RepID=UPI001E5712E9|nr:ABC transporter permease [Aurantimonas sp. VKM B-3413]MCB8838597.1 ABC transporter permease [Aurantimonas sp. VKM B-3413]
MTSVDQTELQDVDGGSGLAPRRTTAQNAARELKRAPVGAKIALVVILAYILTALLAPVLAPYGETAIVGSQFGPWSAAHWLGTDTLGRDMASRMIFAARNTVAIAFLMTIVTFLIGGTMGLVAATIGGVTDQILSRAVDVLMAIPILIFALLLLTIFGTSIPVLVAVIAVLESTRVYRVVRAAAMGVVVMDYVEVARLRGEGTAWIVGREVLPNILSPLFAEFGLRFCFIFLLISALSFLGLGLQPPTADWGAMVRENAILITFGDFTPLLPAGAIAILTIAVNTVVDWFLDRTSGLKD